MLANVFNSVLVSGRAGEGRREWKHGVLYDADGFGSLCYSEKDLIKNKDTCSYAVNSGLIGHINYHDLKMRTNVAGYPNGCSMAEDGAPIFNNAATGLGTKNSKAVPMCNKKKNPQCKTNADCTDSYRTHCQKNECVPTCECDVKGTVKKSGQKACYMKERPCLTKTAYLNTEYAWLTCLYEGKVEMDCAKEVSPWW